LFAVAHLPSPILTLITLVCGLAACLFFLRYRSLFPLVIAHAILGISIAVSVPGPLDHNMRVGLAYLTYAEKTHSPAHPAPLSQP
jgi:membrane protease YdiL (CAAX protease family)